MSELPKVVFSRTLREPLAWDNSRLAKADLVEEVRRLKAESDDPLRTIGSLSVVKGLLEARIVDRLRLTVFPLILGSTGREPVFAGLPDIYLELVDTEVLDARLLTLEYRPLAPSRRTKSKQPQALQPLKGVAPMWAWRVHVPPGDLRLAILRGSLGLSRSSGSSPRRSSPPIH